MADRAEGLRPDPEVVDALCKIIEAKVPPTGPVDDMMLPVVAALGQCAARIMAGLTTDDQQLRRMLEWFAEQVEVCALDSFHDYDHPRFRRLQ